MLPVLKDQSWHIQSILINVTVNVSGSDDKFPCDGKIHQALFELQVTADTRL